MSKTMWMVGSMVLSSALVAGCGSAAVNKPDSPNTKLVATRPSTEKPIGAKGSGNNITTTAARGLVDQSMRLAKQGKAIGVPFAVQQNIGSVQNVWGKPNSHNTAGAGVYWTYSSHDAAFGLNQGDQIMDVRSYSRKLKIFTPSDVTSVLGQSTDTRLTSDSVIYMYPAGANYQLLFVFPRTRTGIGKSVDHVSVFWPQGAVNSMAATQPAPSVVIKKVPSRLGNLFTFTIQNQLKGYRLVELEWLPNRGMPIVNTYKQALSGVANRGFRISVDGKTYSFVYPSSMRNQKGTVRVIYQATSGAAMIGDSSSVILK